MAKVQDESLWKALKALATAIGKMAKAVDVTGKATVDGLANLGKQVDDARIDVNNRINDLVSRIDVQDKQATVAEQASAARTKSHRNLALVVAVIFAGLIIWAIMANNSGFKGISDGLASIQTLIIQQKDADTANTKAVTDAIGINTTAVNNNTEAVKGNGEKLASIDGTLTNINRDMVLNPTAEHRRRLASLESELSDVNGQIAELESRKSGVQVTYGGRLKEAQDKLVGLEGFVKAKADLGEELRQTDRSDLLETRARIAGLEAERGSKLSEITKQIDVLKKRQADLQQQLKELQNPNPAQANSDGKAQPTLGEIQSGQEEIKALLVHNNALSRQNQKDSGDDVATMQAELERRITNGETLPQKGVVAKTGRVQVIKKDGRSVIFDSRNNQMTAVPAYGPDGKLSAYTLLGPDGSGNIVPSDPISTSMFDVVVLPIPY